MKIRIDLKILIFFAVFYFTNQLSSYFIIMFGLVLINQEIDSIRNDEVKRN